MAVNSELNQVAGGMAGYDEANGLTTHVVKAGDTLQSIAVLYGTRAGVILELNPSVQIDTALIPGTVLSVPKIM